MLATGLRKMRLLSRMRAQIRPSCEAHNQLGSRTEIAYEHHFSLSDLTDINIFTKNLDSGLFPGVSSDIWVHGGFADEHAKTASTILSSVKSLISSKGASTVICVSPSCSRGHTTNSTDHVANRSGILLEVLSLSSTPSSSSSTCLRTSRYKAVRSVRHAWVTQIGRTG